MTNEDVTLGPLFAVSPFALSLPAGRTALRRAGLSKGKRLVWATARKDLLMGDPQHRCPQYSELAHIGISFMQAIEMSHCTYTLNVATRLQKFGLIR